MTGTKAAAERLGVSDRTVRNWFHAGRLPGQQLADRRILIYLEEGAA